jgi:hypothetical protein
MAPQLITHPPQIGRCGASASMARWMDGCHRRNASHPGHLCPEAIQALRRLAYCCCADLLTHPQESGRVGPRNAVVVTQFVTHRPSGLALILKPRAAPTWIEPPHGSIDALGSHLGRFIGCRDSTGCCSGLDRATSIQGVISRPSTSGHHGFRRAAPVNFSSKHSPIAKTTSNGDINDPYGVSLVREIGCIPSGEG